MTSSGVQRNPRAPQGTQKSGDHQKRGRATIAERAKKFGATIWSNSGRLPSLTGRVGNPPLEAIKEGEGQAAKPSATQTKKNVIARPRRKRSLWRRLTGGGRRRKSSSKKAQEDSSHREGKSSKVKWQKYEDAGNRSFSSL